VLVSELNHSNFATVSGCGLKCSCSLQSQPPIEMGGSVAQLLAGEIDSSFGRHKIDLRSMRRIFCKFAKTPSSRLVHFAECFLFMHLRKEVPGIAQRDPAFLADWQSLERCR
jgi:hypothetical protein